VIYVPETANGSGTKITKLTKTRKKPIRSSSWSSWSLCPPPRRSRYGETSP